MFTEYWDKIAIALTEVLGEDTVVNLLATMENTRHELLLSLCHEMGLRIREVFNKSYWYW